MLTHKSQLLHSITGSLLKSVKQAIKKEAIMGRMDQVVVVLVCLIRVWKLIKLKEIIYCKTIISLFKRSFNSSNNNNNSKILNFQVTEITKAMAFMIRKTKKISKISNHI